ncbi:putative bifunctional diguanylate cyclase/phosphodiesterase [Neptuniibacter sp. QD48_55]|uniref:putative bifunctional diguanylate cyclase/phosphodiesterase n=1 Tax=Neptuniibacter sp. QD48_55 TaxID=3398212 RepID=UPI0039F49C7E
MTIRIRLIILTLLTVLLCLSMLLGLGWMDAYRADLFKRVDAISRIQVETNALRSQFRLHERYKDLESIERGFRIQKQLQTYLDELKPFGPDEQTYIQSLRHQNESISSLYKRMTHVHSAPQLSINQLNSHNYLLDRLDTTLLSMSEESFRLEHRALANSQQYIQQKAAIIQSMLLSLAILIAISTFLTLRLFRRRLEQIETGIQELAQGNTSCRIEAELSDEIGNLAAHFNEMTEQLEHSTVSIDQLQTEVSKRTSELEKQKHTLKRLAEQDSLTGLSNRSLFMRNLDLTIQRCRDHQTLAAIFFIDLDKFKQINDSLGHSTGDAVLVEMANRFIKSLRRSDLLARIGGDEFTVIIDQLYQQDDAAELARKLIASLEAPYEYDGHTLYLNASIGISIYPNDGTEAIELMKNADTAMYQAKKAGGNCFNFYNKGMNQHALTWLELEGDLREALKHKQLSVYYQPQFDITSNKLVGVEALARWHHPQKGLITPDKFIPLAEEKGLIQQLGTQVLEQACQQVKSWLDQGAADLLLAVNISAKQLEHQQLPQQVQSVLNKTDFPPRLLELEITESCILNDPEEAIRQLNQLKHHGLRLALDDFGTGYSSLSYLKRLPLTKLKIDKSFVDGLDEESDDYAICQAIIALGNSLKLTVIAEGVEQQDQTEILRAEGCNQVQGYLFGKPMTANEFAKRYLGLNQKYMMEEH